jgi:hypothetical protein
MEYILFGGARHAQLPLQPVETITKRSSDRGWCLQARGAAELYFCILSTHGYFFGLPDAALYNIHSR